MRVSFLSNNQRENYGRYTGPPSPHDLARYFHLDDTDHALIAQKRGAPNRLGFAVQLGTVRYLGTFLKDPLVVPQPVLRTLAKQLRIEALDKANPYSTDEQRWQHVTEIRATYGCVEFTEPLIAFRLTRWLYALCWTGTDRPSVLFEHATTWLVTHKVLLPGCTTLERYVARLRSRVEERLWRSLGNWVSLDQQTRLEGFLISSGGTRKSPLDRLRTGPVVASSRSVSLALMRLQAVRGLASDFQPPRASRPRGSRRWPGSPVPPKPARSCAVPILVRQVKYLNINNIVERDHRAIKRVTRPTHNLKSFRAAGSVLAGAELIHMIRKGQFAINGTDAMSFADQFFSLAGMFRPARQNLSMLSLSGIRCYSCS